MLRVIRGAFVALLVGVPVSMASAQTAALDSLVDRFVLDTATPAAGDLSADGKWLAATTGSLRGRIGVVRHGVARDDIVPARPGPGRVTHPGIGASRPVQRCQCLGIRLLALVQRVELLRRHFIHRAGKGDDRRPE